LEAAPLVPIRESNPDKIAILVPVFFSQPPELGLSVRALLQLQIWTTLRKEPDENSNRISFGEGKALWSSQTPKEATYESAIELGRLYAAQMVLWGKAYRLGDGVSILTYLSLPRLSDSRKRHFETWELTFTIAGRLHRLVADVPARQYAFEPMIVPQDMINTYFNLNALDLYSSPTGETKIATIDASKHVSHVRQEGNAIYMRAGKLEGWILLPELAEARSEVVNFSAGLMRIFRADWDGASSLLAQVVDNPGAPTPLKIDSLLLLAHANYQLGRDFTPYLIQAEELDPYAVRVIQYRVMGMLAKMQNAEITERATLAAAAEKYLLERKQFFIGGDKWLLACRELLGSLAKH
jgi:hypothetical protein